MQSESALPSHDEMVGSDDRETTDLTTDPEFLTFYHKGIFTESILQAMHEEGITREGLAEVLGRSPRYVSRVLNEEANFTVEMMVRFCLALNRCMSLVVHRPEEIVIKKQRNMNLPWEGHREKDSTSNSD